MPSLQFKPSDSGVRLNDEKMKFETKGVPKDGKMYVNIGILKVNTGTGENLISVLADTSQVYDFNRLYGQGHKPSNRYLERAQKQFGYLNYILNIEDLKSIDSQMLEAMYGVTKLKLGPKELKTLKKASENLNLVQGEMTTQQYFSKKDLVDCTEYVVLGYNDDNKEIYFPVLGDKGMGHDYGRNLVVDLENEHHRNNKDDMRISIGPVITGDEAGYIHLGKISNS